MRKRREFLVSFLVFLFIVALVCGSVLSIFSFVYYLKQKKQQDAVVSSLEKKINMLNDRISKLESSFGPNSVFDKYISAANFLSNTSTDLERIVEELYDDPTTGYLRLFVMGQESVWVTFRKGDTVYFSRELKPGLAPYKFYYFKTPPIQTQYSLQVPRDCTIVIGKPGMVSFLIYGVGTKQHPTKVITWKDARVNNLESDFSLYIPK
ncbi:hypothetical protein ACSFC1_08030 [Pseudothermotoga sp. U03pept]|uniref:hypothetical protein n=1 Tax=Pseudothermotoga sp. U03pept TaxID=3447012 RepID=UPI003F06631B